MSDKAKFCLFRLFTICVNKSPDFQVIVRDKKKLPKGVGCDTPPVQHRRGSYGVEPPTPKPLQDKKKTPTPQHQTARRPVRARGSTPSGVLRCRSGWGVTPRLFNSFLDFVWRFEGGRGFNTVGGPTMLNPWGVG